MAFIDFTNGEVLTADQMDTVMRQSVMRFADASARDTALSAVLAEGLMCYLDDTNEVLKYDGSSWIDIIETADVITTEGDLIIGDASGNPVRLPVGSADQVLTSDGTTVSFQDAGGGVGEWTQIVTGQSISGASAYQITGLSGYSDYYFHLSNVSFTTADTSAEISQINGDVFFIVDSGTERNFNRNGDGKMDNVIAANLIRINTNTNVGHASFLILGANSTAPAFIQWQGGSDATAGAQDVSYFGNAMMDKADSALDTLEFSTTSGTFDNGNLNVWAR